MDDTIPYALEDKDSEDDSLDNTVTFKIDRQGIRNAEPAYLDDTIPLSIDVPTDEAEDDDPPDLDLYTTSPPYTQWPPAPKTPKPHAKKN